MRHHSTFNRILREGADLIVKDSVVFAKAERHFVALPEDTPLPRAIETLGTAPGNLLLAIGRHGRSVVTNDDLGRWLSSRTADGIIDIGDWSLADVMALCGEAPLVSRSGTATDLVAALAPAGSGTTRRHAVITENGKAGETALGVIDLHRLIH